MSPNSVTPTSQASPTILLVLLALSLGTWTGEPAKGLPMSESTQSSQNPPAPFSHDDWQMVLQRFVDRDGMVDYQGLTQDRAILDRYLKSIHTYSPESHPNLFPTTDQALAYYLNAYNALVFEGVLARGPEQHSVWSGLVSGYNFFVRMKVTVGGRKMSLKKLEEKKILAVFHEPRVHAALNCASAGCPPLSRDAYRAETLEQQLQDITERWINDPYHCRVDPAARTVTLNKIFDWYRGDFIGHEKRNGNPEPSLIHFVNRFRPADRQIPLDYTVRFSDYDKTINSQGQ